MSLSSYDVARFIVATGHTQLPCTLENLNSGFLRNIGKDTDRGRLTVADVEW